MSRRHRLVAAGDAGSAMVASVVVMFSLTGGAILWLTWNVDRAINTTSDANAIAFQAARSAAQAIDPASLRTATPLIDPAGAQQHATATVDTLTTTNAAMGKVLTVTVHGNRVTVTIALTENGRTVTGQGTARLATGVTGENR